MKSSSVATVTHLAARVRRLGPARRSLAIFIHHHVRQAGGREVVAADPATNVAADAPAFPDSARDDPRAIETGFGIQPPATSSHYFAVPAPGWPS